MSHSTTARVSSVLMASDADDESQTIKAEPVPIQFELSEQLFKALHKLPEKSPLYRALNFFDKGKIDLDELNIQFEVLCELENDKTLKAKELLFIEQYKLAILEHVHQHLVESYGVKKAEEAEEEKKQQSKIIYGLKLLFFFIIAPFLLISQGIGDYLYGQSLLLLIPHITMPWIVLGSGLMVVLNSILFLSFEIALFKSFMGINSENNTNHAVLHERQAKETKKINSLLFDASVNQKINPSHAISYCNLAMKFNQNIENLKPKYVAYHEKWYWKLPRYGVVAFGGLMMGAGGYFMATALLTTVAPFLVGTPIGWAVIGISVVSMLSLYFAMRGSAASGMMNAEEQLFNRCKEKLNKFSTRTKQDFDFVFDNQLRSQAGVDANDPSQSPSQSTVKLFPQPGKRAQAKIKQGEDHPRHRRCFSAG